MSEAVVSVDNAKLADELRALDEKFRSLEKREATAAGRKALRKGAMLVRKHAKQIAPVGRSYSRTVKGQPYQHEGGTLRKRGIVMSRGRFGNKHTLTYLVKTATRAKLGIPSQEKGYYPAIVEYGVKKGPRRFEGRKYLRRSLDQKGPEAVKVVIDNAWNEIEKVMAKRK